MCHNSFGIKLNTDLFQEQTFLSIAFNFKKLSKLLMLITKCLLLRNGHIINYYIDMSALPKNGQLVFSIRSY